MLQPDIRGRQLWVCLSEGRGPSIADELIFVDDFMVKFLDICDLRKPPLVSVPYI